MSEVFITGYSGRFPDAANIIELKDNLLQKQDLVSQSKRYPPEYHGLPNRAGHLKEIDKFDSKFFKLNKLHVEGMDPQIRMLLEVAYEAVVDSNLSISSIKGTNTGVYVGHCFSDYHNGVITNIEEVNGYENVGSANSMAANKISYFFDIHGPSFTVDTACSSSLVALDRACNDLSTGIVDRAIVAGVSLNLRPTISKVFQKYNMLSPTGTCHSFDSGADGYCRSETIAALFLQSSRAFHSDARPAGYCRIVGHGVNTNGSTPQGITYPSIEQQSNLINYVCSKFSIDKSSIGYVETHGTGTTAGDNVEITALDIAYGDSDRTIPIGSIKSNMGHAEGASAMGSIIKCLLMYELGMLLPNIHFDPSNLIHEPLRGGRFRVVTECEAFDTTCRVAINNFGFGGVNAHVVLENGGVTFQRSNSKKHFAYGRTEGNVKNELTLSPTDFFLQHRDDIIKYPYRGVASSDSPAVVQKVSDISVRPIVFVYSGQGSQHKEMAKTLLESNDTFRETIYRLSTFLDGVSNSSIDLVSLFETGSMWENKSFSSIGITAVQLGLTNMLAQHGVKPDVVIGHSMGEIACAYADKCMSEAQCIHVAYIRSQLVALLDPDTNIFIFNYPIRESSLDASFYVLINQYNGQYTYRVRKQYSNEFESNHGDYVRKFDNQGAMLFVSMVEDVANEVIAALSCQSTVIACYNSLDGLTLSGSKPEIIKIANYCVENSVFHRSVETGNIAYHSPLLSPYELYLVEQIENVIPPGTAKARSSKWISTSARNNNLCDAAYHTSNIVGSVYFYQAVQQLSSTAYNLIVEVGPHNGLIGQVKRTRPDIEFASYCMSQKEPNAEKSFERLIENLWLQGCNVHPTVSIPPMLSTTASKLPLDERYRVPWDHDDLWKVVSYKDFEGQNGRTGKTKTISYDLSAEHAFLLDHIIQGHSLFPAMGHVYTLWQVAGLKKDIDLSNFQIYRAINIENMTTINFAVVHDTRDTDNMQIYFADEMVASASVVFKDFIPMDIAIKEEPFANVNSSAPEDYVDSKDIYSEFNRFDYNYTNTFHVIERQSIDGSVSKLFSTAPWMHWINYLDGLLQCTIGIGGVTCLKLPTSIKRIQLKSSDSFPAYSHYIPAQFTEYRRIISDVAIITNLEVTPAPLAALADESGSIVRNIKFVPYGPNLQQSNDVDRYQLLFIQYCHDELRKMLTKDVLIQYPHLQHLVRYCKKTEHSARIQPLEKDEFYLEQPVFAITRDIYQDPDLLVNPLLTLSRHPQHNDLYLKDILFSSSLDSLQQCMDIIHENFNFKYKFLEVGTGTGGALRRVYPLIAGFIDSYTASDISVINFDDALTSVTSMRWNINDPFPSNGESSKFDVIFGSNSVHCAKDMLNSLQHIHDTLTEDGFLILEEYTSELPIYLWGLDSFIWNTASCERDHGLWMSNERWVELFVKANLDLVISFNNNATSLYLLRKRRQPENLYHADIVEMSDLISIISNREKSIETKPVIIVGKEDGVLGFVKSYRREPDVHANTVGYLFLNDEIDDRKKSISECPGVDLRLATNVVLNGKHGSFRESSQLTRKVPDNWTIRIEKPGFLNTLYYQESLTYSAEEVEIYMVGLNFKDVMLTYGKLKLDVPITLGIEFSGFYKNGGGSNKRVMGIGMNCLSKTITKPPLLWELPPHLSFEDAATLPCVYATVLYCLDYCAKIQPGQSILIHAGAGGIGQAAIFVCLKRGCKVFTTCSPSKRQFLMEKFNLSAYQIGNSRDSSFKEWLLEATDNAGVDVVLNSLSEDMLLKSLDCVAAFGHFCEIGKYDIMSNNKIGLKIFAQNVTFHGVDISEMIYHPKFNKVLRNLVQQGLDNDEIMPIHVDRIFPHGKLGDALRYMGSGAHVGKILISMRDFPPDAVRPTYYTRGVHVIGGGLGGFGLELAEWLLNCGAEKVYLLSRSKSVKNGYQKRKILCSNSKICLLQCDATSEPDVNAAFSNISFQDGERNITAVWHLSMVLRDSLYSNMSKLQWDDCVRAKINAAELLDKYSRIFAPHLKHFVMFSSISSLYGNAGQTNYAYGNAFMEVLALKRKNSGLPCTVICWGRIGNVGYVSNKGKVTTDHRVVDQGIDSCLYDLHRILSSDISSPIFSCYKPAEPLAATDELSGQSVGRKTCLDNVLRVLGLDAKKVTDEDSLSDLGVDSLQVVTIRSILKGQGVDLPVPEIYKLKIVDIKKVE